MITNSHALTKVQTALLITIIIITSVSGAGAYFLLNKNTQPADNIKIGLSADLDNTQGKNAWQAATLAAEQVNAAGGVLGRNLTIVGEDDDDESSTPDIAVISNAMTRLITVDKANFVITNAAGTGPIFAQQDICSQQKTILLSVKAQHDNLTQRVIDNYDQYKYYFKVYLPNSTAYSKTQVDEVLTLAKYTGFTKIALLGHDATAIRQTFSMLNRSLRASSLEIVYTGYISVGTTDFTSNFAAIQAAGAQILVPYMVSTGTAAFVKQWHDRESPFIVAGFIGLASDSYFWELTEGKCEYVCFDGVPAVAGYPLTNKTLQTYQDYLQRWGSSITNAGAAAYDTVRYILPEAIRRAGSTETDAVIKALEQIDIETSMERHFVFTSSHDVLTGATSTRPAEDYFVTCLFQWQAGATKALISPEKLMQETGATYQYPPWQGPWSK